MIHEPEAFGVVLNRLYRACIETENVSPRERRIIDLAYQARDLAALRLMKALTGGRV